MFVRVWGSSVIGIDAIPVEIEAYTGGGIPTYDLVGLPDSAVRESLSRVTAAVKSTGFSMPRGRLTINLAPAHVRKVGTGFDLPIAMASIIAAAGDEVPSLQGLMLVGELALDGCVRPVSGVLPMAITARNLGLHAVLVPAANAAEASAVDGLEVFPVRTLQEAHSVVSGSTEAPHPYVLSETPREDRPPDYGVDFSGVRGQESVKRALEVAAAGGHNVLMVGPPGAGKTMLARRVPTILPPLSMEEALETTKIHSVGGKLSDGGLVSNRPFRAPHHSVSDAGLCGGGSNPMPGEISLAHNGVLFLDELPEFRRHVLEVMRQPLESGSITIARARSTVRYPANFMLVASMNPCPCGHRNDPSRECVCAPIQIHRYLSRISGPLLDRIDLHIEVTPVPFEELSRRRDAEPSERVRERVTKARHVQSQRFRHVDGIRANARMTSRLVREMCHVDGRGRTLMKQAIGRLGLSARAYARILKVSRTIADLSGSSSIQPEHVSEAIQYRSLDRRLASVGGVAA